MIAINTIIDEQKAKDIATEILDAVKDVCDRHGAEAYLNGLHNTCSGLGMGIQITGKVEGLLNPLESRYAYPLGLEGTAKHFGITADDYGKTVEYRGEQVVFTGLKAAGYVEYNFHNISGSNKIQFVFKGGKYYHMVDYEEGIALLRGE